MALLSAAGGVVAPAWPGITAYVLTIWIRAWAPIACCIEIGVAFARGETVGERALSALTGLVPLVTVFGLLRIFYGMSAMTASFRRRHPEKTVADIASAAMHGL